MTLTEAIAVGSADLRILHESLAILWVSTLCVRAGEVCYLRGGNGAGKITLLGGAAVLVG